MLRYVLNNSLDIFIKFLLLLIKTTHLHLNKCVLSDRKHPSEGEKENADVE